MPEPVRTALRRNPLTLGDFAGGEWPQAQPGRDQPPAVGEGRQRADRAGVPLRGGNLPARRPVPEPHRGDVCGNRRRLGPEPLPAAGAQGRRPQPTRDPAERSPHSLPRHARGTAETGVRRRAPPPPDGVDPDNPLGRQSRGRCPMVLMKDNDWKAAPDSEGRPMAVAMVADEADPTRLVRGGSGRSGPASGGHRSVHRLRAAAACGRLSAFWRREDLAARLHTRSGSRGWSL
jgi:hypothetical protein